MQLQDLSDIRRLEGRRVHVCFTDGSQADCQLVSVPHRPSTHRANTLWLADEADMAVPISQVVSVEEAPEAPAPAA